MGVLEIMRTILIDIDAGELYCGKCQHLGETDDGVACQVFLIYDESMNEYNMPRPAECLAAEQRAKERKE